MSDHAILQGHDVVECDLNTWAEWFGSADRTVAKSRIQGFLISTVFLGINFSSGGRPPLWFETMIFKDDKGYKDLYCDRYTTWEEALEGHHRACKSCRNLEVEE